MSEKKKKTESTKKKSTVEELYKRKTDKIASIKAQLEKLEQAQKKLELRKDKAGWEEVVKTIKEKYTLDEIKNLIGWVEEKKEEEPKEEEKTEEEKK